MSTLSTSSPQRLAVLGSPIAHSRSPQLHAAAYAALGLDWRYGRFEVDADGLESFLAERGDWRGFSLTMPLKHRALELAAGVDEVAGLTGSVNTLVRAGNGWRGFNTDVPGLVRALREAGVGSAETAIVLGAGATAASAVVAAAEVGARRLVLAVRSPERAAAATQLARSVGLQTLIVTLDALEGVEADLVISTLPGGTRPAFAVPEALTASAPLFDVAYDPWPSALGAAWADAGGRAVSGIGMLLHQAVVQVRVFVGGDPTVPLPDEDAVLAAMRAAVA